MGVAIWKLKLAIAIGSLNSIKIVKENESAERKLEEAVNQIKDRKSGYESSSQEVIRVALIFSLEKREFVKWKAVSL